MPIDLLERKPKDLLSREPIDLLAPKEPRDLLVEPLPAEPEKKSPIKDFAKDYWTVFTQPYTKTLTGHTWGERADKVLKEIEQGNLEHVDTFGKLLKNYVLPKTISVTAEISPLDAEIMLVAGKILDIPQVKSFITTPIGKGFVSAYRTALKGMLTKAPALATNEQILKAVKRGDISLGEATRIRPELFTKELGKRISTEPITTKPTTVPVKTGGLPVKVTQPAHPIKLTPEVKPDILAQVPKSMEGKGITTGLPEPVAETTGKIRESRAYTNYMKNLDTLAKDVPEYQRMKYAEDMARADKFANSYPNEILKVARGEIAPPEGITQSSITNKAIEKAVQNNDIKLTNELITNQSLRATRAGQEISVLKALYDQDDVFPIAQELLKIRTNQALKKNYQDPLSKVKVNDKIMEKVRQEAKITDQEMGKIMEFSKDLKLLRTKTDKWGNPDIEYFKKRHELVDWLNYINPRSNLDVAVGVIGRGSMLFNLKTPLLNIESNTLWGAEGVLERRLLGLQFNAPNTKEVIDFTKHNTKLYTKTGTDLIILDDVVGDYVVRGETITHSQGGGLIRKYGRFMETYSFRYGQGVPDIFAESFHFADYLNLESYKIAGREGLRGKERQQRALELMKDAMNIKPETSLGQDLRVKARAEALFYTWKNKSKFSDLGIASRKIINQFGNIFGLSHKLGEAIAPFVKTPANIIGVGVDMSGGYGFKGANEIYKAYKTRDINSVSQEHLHDGIRYFTRLGMGAIITAIIGNMIKDQDYMPDYYSATQDEKNFAKQFNIPFNSVKVGSKWVSFDYFGAFGAPLKAYIHARKYGDTPINKLYQYSLAVGRQIMTFPGFQNLAEFMDSSWKQVTNKKDTKSLVDNFYNGTMDFMSSRFIPSILGDFAKAIDESEREAKGLGKITAKLPKLRETLPERINNFGENVQTQPFLSDLLFGARVKTTRDDPTYNELERLLEQGELPSLSDITKTSTRVKKMQEQLGEVKFREMILYFGGKFKIELDREISKNSYKRLSDEDKKDRIIAIKNSILDDTLDKFGYKSPTRRIKNVLPKL